MKSVCTPTAASGQSFSLPGRMRMIFLDIDRFWGGLQMVERRKNEQRTRRNNSYDVLEGSRENFPVRSRGDLDVTFDTENVRRRMFTEDASAQLEHSFTEQVHHFISLNRNNTFLYQSRNT